VVAEFKAAVHAADLVLLATPEYNGGLPAVLKNAVDWGSRPPRPQAWDGKPVAIMGATPGRLGTALAQRSLRESLAGLNAHVMPQPRVLLSGAGAVFDDDLELADGTAGKHLDRFMSAAAEWAYRFR
jgi:chromate reductase